MSSSEDEENFASGEEEEQGEEEVDEENDVESNDGSQDENDDEKDACNEQDEKSEKDLTWKELVCTVAFFGYISLVHIFLVNYFRV